MVRVRVCVRVRVRVRVKAGISVNTFSIKCSRSVQTSEKVEKFRIKFRRLVNVAYDW